MKVSLSIVVLYSIRLRLPLLSATVLVVFVVGPHTLLDPEGRHWSWEGQWVGSAYVLVGLAFLVLQAVRPLEGQDFFLKSAARSR
ncbi:hypothetical protein EV643_101309 [Kribbella sp. VKM Ac-2527]|uniref:Uncharacterized protein n=1 Tax=Kribbella caucasensis TaxID=2512215 RepID=A0A4V3CB47_9ACTN|nr:hypothetical protein [Kribbella sp. VKM Ac-2527]TDO54520.1 hypothetical protein EV643_101309 [Kribbella sp. VKM Ac-2527]